MYTARFKEVSEIFFFFLNVLQWGLIATGIGVIFWSGVRAANIFLRQCFFSKKICVEDQLDNVRRVLGYGIIIGLEFILAADVISTVLLPDYYNLGMLGMLVLIRTVLNFFLDRELQHLRKAGVVSHDNV